MNSKWNPAQYNKFKDQRAKPFNDLVGLVDKQNLNRVLDLGCGTGELTKSLFDSLKPKSLIGLDASDEMLAESVKYRMPGLEFKLGKIEDFGPDSKFDLIFSNAALQWVPDHEKLFPKIFSWISEDGQIAIQMPCNLDHPSHSVARRVAQRLFPAKFSARAMNPTLSLERYAEILYQNGFHQQICRIEVYGHPMSSGTSVIEWTKGTSLTAYQAQLSEPDFQNFLKVYSEELIQEIGNGPYFYAFKRFLIWGRKTKSLRPDKVHFSI